MKIKYIDSLRGIAVLGVLSMHCSLIGNKSYLPDIVMSFFSNGLFGVQLFYMVSAFTLFLSMNNRFHKENSLYKNFFIRRFFRIAPMYYLGIIYYLWQTRYDSATNTISNWDVISNFTFTHGFSPYWVNHLVPGGWSIAIEMSFYCLVPFLYQKLRNLNQAFGFVIITLILRFVSQFIFNRLHPIDSEIIWQEYLYYYLPNQLPIFALGFLLFFMVSEKGSTILKPIFLLITSGFVFIQLVGIPIFPKHFLFSIAFLIIAFSLSKIEYKFLVNPFTIYLGKISYSMYLVHFAMIFWLNKFYIIDLINVTDTFSSVLNLAVRFLLLLGSTIVVSTLTYNLIEVPVQNLGKRIINKISNRDR